MLSCSFQWAEMQKYQLVGLNPRVTTRVYCVALLFIGFIINMTSDENHIKEL